MTTPSRRIDPLRRGGVGLALLLGALLLANVSGYGEARQPGDAAGRASQEAAEAVHGFELSDLDGTIRSSDEWNGKPLLVNFWATWCVPCRAEMPVLMELHEKYADQGFEVIGLAAELDAAGTDPEKVATFVEKYGIGYPILFGELDAVMDISRRYGNEIGGLPYSAFIDSDGVVRHVKFGELTVDEAEEMLRDIL